MRTGNRRVTGRVGQRKAMCSPAALSLTSENSWLILDVVVGGRSEGIQRIVLSRGQAKEMSFRLASQCSGQRNTTITKTRKTFATVIETGHN